MRISFLAALVCSFSGTSGFTYAPQEKVHAEVNVDNHRVVYVDANLASPSVVHLHIKLSNGWRLDPWWVTVLVHFTSSGSVYNTIRVSAKCPASFGSRAHECNYDFEAPGSNFWSAVDGISIEGRDWGGGGGKDDSWTVPIYDGSF